MTTLDFKVIESEAGFFELSEKWNNLLNRSLTREVFLTWEWHWLIWKHFGNGQLKIIVAFDERDYLIGIAPFKLTKIREGVRTLEFLTGDAITDYHDFIVAKENNEFFYTQLIDYLTKGEQVIFDEISLTKISADSPTVDFFEKYYFNGSRSINIQTHVVSPIVKNPGSWDDFLKNAGKKQRHEITRKFRRIDREVENNFFWLKDFQEDWKKYFEHFTRLNKLSNQEKEKFMDQRMEAFFGELTETFLQKEWLRIAFLEVENEIAASMFILTYNNRFSLYNSGFNPGYFRNLSLGSSLIAWTIKEGIDAGVDYYDFLNGDEEYKYRFGAKDKKLKKIIIK